MIEKIESVQALKSALAAGLVSLSCDGAGDGESWSLLATTNEVIIGRVSGAFDSVQSFNAYSQQFPFDGEAIALYDVIQRRAIEFQPAIFDGVATAAGVIAPYSEPFRSTALDFSQGESVVVRTGDGVDMNGSVVAINTQNAQHYYVVLLGEDQCFRSVTFSRHGVSAQGSEILCERPVKESYAWLDDDGKEFYPAIDLGSNGYDAPCPLVFVIYDEVDATKTVALDREGKDAGGNQVLRKVAVDYRAVETERYLVANGSDVLLLSKEALGLISVAGSFVMPVLAYYKGLSVVHISLPSRG
jgi:hypothetical protein